MECQGPVAIKSTHARNEMPWVSEAQHTLGPTAVFCGWGSEWGLVGLQLTRPKTDQRPTADAPWRAAGGRLGDVSLPGSVAWFAGTRLHHALPHRAFLHGGWHGRPHARLSGRCPPTLSPAPRFWCSEASQRSEGSGSLMVCVRMFRPEVRNTHPGGNVKSAAVRPARGTHGKGTEPRAFQTAACSRAVPSSGWSGLALPVLLCHLEQGCSRSPPPGSLGLLSDFLLVGQTFCSIPNSRAGWAGAAPLRLLRHPSKPSSAPETSEKALHKPHCGHYPGGFQTHAAPF